MKEFGKWFLIVAIWSSATCISLAQNALKIPPALTGTVFNLNIQNGTSQFYTGVNTPTYGINGPLLGPTLIINKGDSIVINVSNSLTGFGNSTTIHWHGLHVPAKFDGGPHQVINQGSTWSPSFRIRNEAGTFWYHPHGDNKTDLHVSKGIAGMIIVKDSNEASLTLPRTYGVDDYPIIVQTKAFDILTQIAIATEMDTAVMVNGTLNPYLDAPAQVIRLRLLNGSSMRSYNFGFSSNKTFKMIATDAGLLDSAITLTRIRLSPGERAEILLDLNGMNGQTIRLNSYGSELPNGIYGAATVKSMMGGTIPDYISNPLNGADFEILKINVVVPTVNPAPVTTMPGILNSNKPWTSININRTFTFTPDSMGNATAQVAGPFAINGVHFDMDKVNVTTYLNNTEKWKIQNNTGIAHPFHIHDMHFYLLNINGAPVPDWEKGKKDVVLVMPMEYVEFTTKFEDFASNAVPYMYHCHLLHHEDDGMMGSFLVLDTLSNTGVKPMENNISNIHVFPNPSSEYWNVHGITEAESISFHLFNAVGQEIYNADYLPNDHTFNERIDNVNLKQGIYFLHIQSKNRNQVIPLQKVN
jgi:bilirubin oxidase